MEKLEHCQNLEKYDIVTPINVDRYAKLLKRSHFPGEKSRYLINGFTRGFDLGYRGPLNRRNLANNIPIQEGVGSIAEMWRKLMKEVKVGRVAGPFSELHCHNYVQSPIGLVPKAGGQTRLIFHLSFDFGIEECNRSINYHIPESDCSVKYNDIDCAISACL